MPRPVTVVNAEARKELEVEVVVPVADMASLGETVEPPASAGAAAGPLRRSIWPAIHPRLLELVQSHHSTLIFTNARRLAERLAARLNELHLEQAQAGRARPRTTGRERLHLEQRAEGDRSGGPPCPVGLTGWLRGPWTQRLRPARHTGWKAAVAARPGSQSGTPVAMGVSTGGRA